MEGKSAAPWFDRVCIGYAAPRFLLPAHALLALPVAVSLLAACLAAHLAVQYVVLEHTLHSSAANRDNWSRTASALHTLGVRAPCLLSGYEAVPIAFYTGCGSAQTDGHDTSTTGAALARAGVLHAYVAPFVRQGR
ncbi:hypothetical protein ACFW93_11745 [Streptomyces canus]|uniref:hypothetical protein n=1 Tax=Streptomyces canus TaxID=58343 RepID=UPI0036C45991